MTEAQQRARFEAWIAAPPFEKGIGRWPTAETLHAWPGQYRDYEVQLAWEAWMAALSEPEAKEEGV